MSRNPIVSVIVIFLNAKQFIGEAIESVLAQTYDGWELLLVDDGATDRSAAVARSYAARYPDKVRYLQHAAHANRGMSASRNLGIRHARGRYVAFLDADDAWFPQTLAQQVAVLEAHPDVAMVYGPLEWWYSWTGMAADRERDYVEAVGVPADSVIDPPTLLPLFLQNKAAVPSGILVRRDVIERVGGFEDSFHGEYEDQVFCAKLCLRFPVFASSRTWYRYRQHAHSCVSIAHRTGQTHAARKAFLNWLTRYLMEQHINDATVWRALLRVRLRLQHPRLYGALQQGNGVMKQVRNKVARTISTRVETAS